MGKKSMAIKTIHTPVTLIPHNIYLRPFILYLSHWRYLIPIIQITTATIVTRMFITSNILSISPPKSYNIL